MNFHPYFIMSLAWALVIVWTVLIVLTNYKKQPKALFALALVEFWERFAYHGMRSLLILFMLSETIDFPSHGAFRLYTSFNGLYHLVPVFGGLLAERVMGYRRSIAWGTALMTCGFFALALETEFAFFTGLAMILVGSGFFRSNGAGLLGEFYAADDIRRDSGFAVFYYAINIGAFLTGLTCGVVGELEGWNWGFNLAGAAMFIGFLCFLFINELGILENKGWSHLESSLDGGKKVIELDLLPTSNEGILDDHILANIEKSQSSSSQSSPQTIPSYRLRNTISPPNLFNSLESWVVCIVSLLFVPLFYLLLRYLAFVDNFDINSLILILSIIAILSIFLLSFEYPKIYCERIWAMLLLFFFSTFFWMFFELSFRSIRFLTESVSDNESTLLQNLSPVFLALLIPLLALWWLSPLERYKQFFTAPMKMGFGFVTMGLGFFVLMFGATIFTSTTIVPLAFFIIMYLFLAIAELFFSLVGLSLVSKIAPPNQAGIFIGFWYFSYVLAQHLSIFVDYLFPWLFRDPTNLTVAADNLRNLGACSIALGAALIGLALSLLPKWLNGLR